MPASRIPQPSKRTDNVMVVERCIPHRYKSTKMHGIETLTNPMTLTVETVSIHLRLLMALGSYSPMYGIQLDNTYLLF